MKIFHYSNLNILKSCLFFIIIYFKCYQKCVKNTQKNDIYILHIKQKWTTRHSTQGSDHRNFPKTYTEMYCCERLSKSECMALGFLPSRLQERTGRRWSHVNGPCECSVEDGIGHGKDPCRTSTVNTSQSLSMPPHKSG